MGLEVDDRVWDVTVFTKHRGRLLRGEIVEAFFQAVLEEARELGGNRREFGGRSKAAGAQEARRANFSGGP